MKHVLALVCLFSTFFCHSQDRLKKTPLGIGDTLYKNLLVEGKHLTNRSMANKYILISFWSPTCGSCFHQLEQLEALQHRFSKSLLIIPVTQSSEEQVRQIYSKVKLQLPDLPMRYSDSLLSSLLPYRSVPHQVWVNKGGVVRYITDNEAVNEENINAFIKERAMVLPVKQDLMDYDASVPLYQEGGGRFLSRLSSYTYFMDELEGLPFEVARSVKDTIGQLRGLRIVNGPLLHFVSVAAAKGDFRELIKDRPVLFAIKPADSLYLNRKYSYESWGPPRDKSKLYSELQKDLERTFPFHWHLEWRPVKHYTLVQIGMPVAHKKETGKKRAETHFQGTTELFLKQLKEKLDKEGVFEDQSVYRGELTLPMAAFACLSDMKAALQRQGFDLQVTSVEKEVIVVTSK